VASQRTLGKIESGFFSITAVDDAENYVAWHQTDHTCEQFRISGLAWGHRYFAPPACVEASGHRPHELRDAVHIQNYLFEDAANALTDFGALGLELMGRGRFRSGVRGFLQVPQRLTGTFAAPDLPIAADAVPYRPHTGIYLVVEEQLGPRHVAAWREQSGDDTLRGLLREDGVVGVWTYAAEDGGEVIDGSVRMPSSTEQITAIYLDGDPVLVSSAIAGHLRRRWAGAPVRPILAGPYLSVAPPPASWCTSSDPRW